MSTELQRQSTAVDALNGFDPQQIIQLVAQATAASDVNDVRARVAAAKAWAKVHNKVKQVRLDLLRIEVAALKRLGELGVFDGLNAGEIEAAKWLASATDDEVETALSKAGQNVSTAAGVVRLAKEFESIRERHDAGYAWAKNPTVNEDGFAGYSDDDLDDVRHEVPTITGVLNEIIADYTEASEPFTVDEVAEAVLSQSKIPHNKHDAAFMDGIRRACRDAVGKWVPKRLGPTVIPQFITCRIDDGKFVRIPTVNAKLPHLDDMIAIREESIQRDQDAIKRLMEIRDKLDGLLNGRSRSETPIGKLLLGVELK